MQPNNVHSVLAVGNEFDYILFQTAITLAENGLNIWYISPEKFDRRPENIKTPHAEILKQITFMYLTDGNALITHLNGIHLWRKTPDVIIVSNFEHYCNFTSSNYSPRHSAFLATSLLDSAALCASNNSTQCYILATSTINQNDLSKIKILRDLYFKTFINKNNNDDFHKEIIKLFK